MNIKDILEVAVMQIPLIIGITWKAASEKAAIFTAIDDVKDSHATQIHLLEKTLALLAQESQMGRTSLSEKVTGQGKRFGAKFERLEQKVDDVIDYKSIISRLDGISTKLDGNNQ